MQDEQNRTGDTPALAALRATLSEALARNRINKTACRARGWGARPCRRLSRPTGRCPQQTLMWMPDQVRAVDGVSYGGVPTGRLASSPVGEALEPLLYGCGRTGGD